MIQDSGTARRNHEIAGLICLLFFSVMIAVGLPLAIALFRGEFLPAVYGAVAGFYTMFVDNGGNTSERITVMMYMTVGMLLAGIAGVAGHYVQGAPLAFLLAFAVFTGWLQGAAALPPRWGRPGCLGSHS